MQCLSSLLVIGHERSFYEIYKDERYCIVLKIPSLPWWLNHKRSLSLGRSLVPASLGQSIEKPTLITGPDSQFQMRRVSLTGWPKPRVTSFRSLSLGRSLVPSKPWPIDVDLGLLVVGLVVAGSHPGKRINLSLTITSGVPWTKKGWISSSGSVERKVKT